MVKSLAPHQKIQLMAPAKKDAIAMLWCTFKASVHARYGFVAGFRFIDWAIQS